MRSTWFAVALLLLATPSAYSQVSPPTQPEGRITGIVVDEQNQPINDAQVSTQVSLPGEIVGNWGAQSDSNGQFRIEHLPMGTFGVVASKNEDGYVGFDNFPGIQTVTLTPEAPLANVVIKLGPREGILVPSVKDKVTGKPLCDFMLRWYVSGANSSLSGGGGFSRWSTRQAIPAEKDVLIVMVSARGYKKLVPTDPSDPSKPLRLHVQRGEVKSLSIELEPEAKDAPTAH
jgi:Carboxypeptidase regulatory-like domain